MLCFGKDLHLMDFFFFWLQSCKSEKVLASCDSWLLQDRLKSPYLVCSDVTQRAERTFEV